QTHRRPSSNRPDRRERASYLLRPKHIGMTIVTGYGYRGSGPGFSGGRDARGMKFGAGLIGGMIAVGCAVGALAAADPAATAVSPQAAEFFETRVRPVLAEN